jgi:hypothetical protein
VDSENWTSEYGLDNGAHLIVAGLPFFIIKEIVMKSLLLRMFFTVMLLISQSKYAVAGFSWGSGCEGGVGAFQQQIEHYGGDYEKSVTVGTIPSKFKNIYISLKSDQDVDIRLYGSSGEKIIHWPHGILRGPNKELTTYDGVSIEYSGYNGDGSGLGHEYIRITGTTSNDFIMKAFGYKAGYATVDYSWEGKDVCDTSSSTTRNSGNFHTTLSQDARSYLGLIPVGIDNPVVFLKATNDLDIELYDSETNEFVVGWRSKHIDSSKKITEIYRNDKITWSGWDGRYADVFRDTKSGIKELSEKGREYIRIHGKSKNGYRMYVYAYQAGSVAVEYSWGVNPVYAGILGMGTDYLMSESNSNPSIYSAINGVMSEVMTYFYGFSYAGYGHTEEQANQIANGINISYANGDSFIPGNNMKGQVGIAIKLSNYARGSGDINIFSSGNVQYIYNKIKSQISENSNNVVFVSGHSSGGGDAQDILWKFNGIGQSIKSSFQIDSTEIELSNWGDARIPPNTEHAYNYYSTWLGEGNIYADDASKTTIENNPIDNPKCNTDGKGLCMESAHEAIDNDIKVWGDILIKMKNYAGIKFDFLE